MYGDKRGACNICESPLVGSINENAVIDTATTEKQTLIRVVDSA
jgi:hypothetical protein